MDYQQFIAGKHFKSVDAGFDYVCSESWLFDYQRACVEWACRRGKAALFLDTGLGKTNCELAWARAVAEHTGKPVLILAPLCVSVQIIQEAARFGFDVHGVRDDSEIRETGIYITNYENMHNIDTGRFSGVVLDESSILKGMAGKMRAMITDAFRDTPYRLSASATPSPNDYMELGTQCEFLGILSQVEMLATFFIHDGGDTAKWRLKGHGQKKFFEWLASWAVIMRDPSAYGFAKKPELPPLNIRQVTIDSGITDGLLPKLAQSLGDRLTARRDTVAMRCAAAAELANSIDGPVLVWCNLNDEADMLHGMIPRSINIQGSDSVEFKEAGARWFCGDDSWKVEKICDKLTASQRSLLQCSPIELTASNKSEKSAKRTCASTTQKTKESSGQGTAKSGQSTTKTAEKNTQKMMRIAKDAGTTQENGKSQTQGQEQTSVCESTASPLSGTSQCLMSKEGFAQYAEGQTMATNQQEDSTLTIATKPEKSEGCCACHATTDSESSRTQSSHCEAQQPTLSHNSGRILISKPRMFGYGLNFQHCHNMIFVGLSDSWEQYYQAIRRCWRFGQTQTVNVYVVTADIEGMVVENIKRKDDQSDRMMDEMASIAKDFFNDYSKASNALRAYKPQMAAPLPKFI